MINGIKVTAADVVASGSCITGARQWFTAQGLDFKAFMRDGLAIETLRALDCPLASRACDAAEIRTGSNSQ